MYIIKTIQLMLFKEKLGNSPKILTIINKAYFTGEITSHVAQTVNTEQL